MSVSTWALQSICPQCKRTFPTVTRRVFCSYECSFQARREAALKRREDNKDIPT